MAFINDWLDALPTNMSLPESFPEFSFPSPPPSTSFPADLLDIDLQMNSLDPFIQQLLEAVDSTPKMDVLKLENMQDLQEEIKLKNEAFAQTYEPVLTFDLASLSPKSPDYLSPDTGILSDENNSVRPMEDMEVFTYTQNFQTDLPHQQACLHTITSPTSEPLEMFEIKPEVMMGEETVESENTNTTLTSESKTPYSDATQCRKRSRNGHIKRPMNAFMIFAQKERRRLASSSSTLHNAAISKQCGLTWKSLTPMQKRPFEEESIRLKCLHEKEFPQYKYKPKKKVRGAKETVIKTKKMKTGEEGFGGNIEEYQEVNVNKTVAKQDLNNYLTVNGVKMHAFNATLVYNKNNNLPQTNNTLQHNKVNSTSTLHNNYYNNISINIDNVKKEKPEGVINLYNNSNNHNTLNNNCNNYNDLNSCNYNNTNNNNTNNNIQTNTFVLLDSRKNTLNYQNKMQSSSSSSSYPTPPPE